MKLFDEWTVENFVLESNAVDSHVRERKRERRANGYNKLS